MTQPVSVTLKVNDRALTATAATADTLLTVLRDQFLLTGAKRGCNQGVCGACTVLADGRPVRSCLSLALDCDDRRIETIEGRLDAATDIVRAGMVRYHAWLTLKDATKACDALSHVKDRASGTSYQAKVDALLLAC